MIHILFAIGGSGVGGMSCTPDPNIPDNISSIPTRHVRFKKHQKYGWRVYKHKEFKSGLEAFNVETKTLKWLRNKRNLLPYLTIEQMPQAGWSETVDALEIDLPTIWAKVEEFSKKSKKGN